MTDTVDTTVPNTNGAPAVDVDPLQDPVALSAVLNHCGSAAIATFPTYLAAISSQNSLDASPPSHKDGEPVRFEYAEHRFLGDALELSEHKDQGNGSDFAAKYNPFKLPNGLSVTYGQINGLAGDFFGSDQPICLGGTPAGMLKNFQDAYNLFASSSEGKAAAEKLLDVLKKEVDAVDAAIKGESGKTVEQVYQELDQDFTLDNVTTSLLKPGVTYLTLAQKNLDHFGQGARTAYSVGHGWALQVASSGKKEDLLHAYTINAFADHFLEDLFSAGHLRVPRAAMMDNKFANICAKFMHDEDNHWGVWVDNASHDHSWRTYGDKKLFNDDNKPNKAQIFVALTHSAGEVYEAYTKKTAKTDPKTFDVWKYTATAESANSQTNNYAPLFQIFDNVIHYRKVLPDANRAAPPKTFGKDAYELVVSDAFYLKAFPNDVKVTLSWAYLAYQLAPSGSIKENVKSYLRSKIPSWLWGVLGIDK